MMGTLFQHRAEGKRPCRRKPLGRWEPCAETPFKGGVAFSALWSPTPSFGDGGGSEALLQLGKAGQVASFLLNLYFSFHTCLCLTESHWCHTSVLSGWASCLLWSVTHGGNEKWLGWVYVDVSIYMHTYGYITQPLCVCIYARTPLVYNIACMFIWKGKTVSMLHLSEEKMAMGERKSLRSSFKLNSIAGLAKSYSSGRWHQSRILL